MRIPLTILLVLFFAKDNGSKVSPTSYTSISKFSILKSVLFSTISANTIDGVIFKKLPSIAVSVKITPVGAVGAVSITVLSSIARAELRVPKSTEPTSVL